MNDKLNQETMTTEQQNGSRSEYTDFTGANEEQSGTSTTPENTTSAPRVSVNKVPIILTEPVNNSSGNSADSSDADATTGNQIEQPKASPPAPVKQSGDEALEEWIDRTNEALVEIGNGYTLTPTLTNLYLTNNRIKVMKNLEVCRGLQELVLRQNSITVVQGLDTLENLVELDLYSNHIDEIPPSTFEANPNLKRLDLSFNQLRTLDTFPSANLPNLEELYLIGNKIRTITAMRDMPKLVMLELGDNRIRDMENLEQLTSLEGLWLGRNKLTKIENLEPLVNLRRLSLQSNRLKAIEGLSHLQHLEELYLSHNGIESMQGVESLTALRVLDLGVNFVEHIEGVDKLVYLKEFWINGNKLRCFDELLSLGNAEELETVYLEGNPLAKDPDYQRKALELLPKSLEQLDAQMVEDVRRGLLDTPVVVPPGPDADDV